MSRRAFLARSAELRREVMRPVFEEVLPIFIGRGHACEIQEEEFAARPGGVSTEASIRLRLAPAVCRARRAPMSIASFPSAREL